MSDIYNDVIRSILAYCNSVIERNGLQNFEVFDFDAHAVEQEYPKADLIGVTDFSIQNRTEHHDVTCMILVSTQSDDANLKRLRPVMGILYKELKPGAQNIFPVVDESGLTRGFLTVQDEVMATPVGSTKTRPVSGIAVSFAVGYRDLP